MSFWIQTGNPALLDVDQVADSFFEAIGLVYQPDTEYLVLSWNNVLVPVNYAEDLYVFVDDIIVLLETIQAPGFTHAQLVTGASSFFTTWEIRREETNLIIDSRWESILGSYEFVLNERSQLTLTAEEFTRQWLKMLRRVVDDITSKAVRIEDDDMFLRAKALLADCSEHDGA
ncbi:MULTISPECIES: hypothetical protein [unclassified Streptomyces]|uniref:hypothetical protein n=1 Tax=unclassified Streptomyces TaxID=2593676 RepID=UPI002E0EB253|nr:hypothetical protein OG452_16280 [Streptomyces sp. NBC_01197]WSS50574.1 hypothetical protein OG708_19240 [Streptomyces sp. NBC_01180]